MLQLKKVRADALILVLCHRNGRLLKRLCAALEKDVILRVVVYLVTLY